MPHRKRNNLGNIVYHVLNRANGRLRIFKKAGLAIRQGIEKDGLKPSQKSLKDSNSKYSVCFKLQY